MQSCRPEYYRTIASQFLWSIDRTTSENCPWAFAYSWQKISSGPLNLGWVKLKCANSFRAIKSIVLWKLSLPIGVWLPFESPPCVCMSSWSSPLIVEGQGTKQVRHSRHSYQACYTARTNGSESPSFMTHIQIVGEKHDLAWTCGM